MRQLRHLPSLDIIMSANCTTTSQNPVFISHLLPDSTYPVMSTISPSMYFSILMKFHKTYSWSACSIRLHAVFYLRTQFSISAHGFTRISDSTRSLFIWLIPGYINSALNHSAVGELLGKLGRNHGSLELSPRRKLCRHGCFEL